MEKVYLQHPLQANKEQINEKGLMVFEDVNSLPKYKELFISPFLVIILNISGTVKLEYNMNPLQFEKNDIAVAHANTKLYAIESSDDYKAILAVISPEMQEEIKVCDPSTYLQLFHYVKQPQFKLEEAQANKIYSMLKLLQAMSEENTANRKMILRDLLHVLIVTMQDYRRQNGNPDRHLSPREELFSRFYDAIIKHHRKNREVRFYAELFNLTPKHFASVIKTQTGINAHEWINNYVIIQAKSMLKGHTLSVQEIATRLGFNEQATFSRYFRNCTGQTPTEYRNS